MLLGCAGPPADHEATGLIDPFMDVTEVAGLHFVHFNGMTGRRYVLEMMGAGGALADFDGDGDLDLYLRQGRLMDDGTTTDDTLLPPPPGSPRGDRLLRADRVDSAPGLRFVERSTGLDLEDYGMGAASGDFDRDGDVDLYLTAFGENRLLRNRGDGTFEDFTKGAGVADSRASEAAVFFDFDSDGWLDLYVGNYIDFSMATHKPCFSVNSAVDYCGPLSFASEPDRLFRNRGDGTFEDASAASGLARAFGAGLGAVARDFDGDGGLDLYVANDGGENLLWRNRGDGTFEEAALLAGCAVNARGEKEGSMGIAAADFDGDLDVDLLVTHLDQETNTLYLNDGSGFFTDGSTRSGLGVASRGHTGFGTGPIDLENDGLLDVLIVNGEVRAIAEQEAQGEVLPLRQHDQLFRNLGGGAFEEISDRAASLSAPFDVGRAAIFGDLDGDGATDVLVTNNAGPARLLLGNGAGDAHWVGVRFHDFAEKLDGRGSRAWITAGGRTLLRYASSDGSYLSAGDPRAHFGLGSADAVERLEVVWPDGERRRYLGLPSDRYVTVGRAVL
jgi:hypothetical protein